MAFICRRYNPKTNRPLRARTFSSHLPLGGRRSGIGGAARGSRGRTLTKRTMSDRTRWPESRVPRPPRGALLGPRLLRRFAGLDETLESTQLLADNSAHGRGDAFKSALPDAAACQAADLGDARVTTNTQAQSQIHIDRRTLTMMAPASCRNANAAISAASPEAR